MSDRLPSGVVATALIRRVNQAGGFAMVLAKGDAQGGAILVVMLRHGAKSRLFERGIGPEGRTMLIDSTPFGDVDEYWRGRCARDPDLWVIEVDVADAERFAAETIIDD